MHKRKFNPFMKGLVMYIPAFEHIMGVAGPSS